MEGNLKVAWIQYDIVWEDPQSNKEKILALINDNNPDCDLLVLPEMFTTGFSMNVEQLAETPEGLTAEWLCSLASKLNCTVTGSVIIQEDKKFYNRLFWVEPRGAIRTYDKKHLFTLAKEDRYFTAGKERKIFIIHDGLGVAWKICPLICYDLRFPAWSRNNEDYDLLIYVANFPEKRAYAWKQLLIARAIENQVYTLGVNRIGTDGIGIPYSGDSALLRYDGRPILESLGSEGVFVQNIIKKDQKIFRRAYNFLADQDEFIFSV